MFHNKRKTGEDEKCGGGGRKDLDDDDDDAKGARRRRRIGDGGRLCFYYVYTNINGFLFVFPILLCVRLYFLM